MTDLFQRLGIAQKLAAGAAAVCLLVSLLLLITSHQAARREVLANAAHLADALATQLARDSSALLLRQDVISLQATLNELTENELVAHAAIYDVRQQPRAEAGTRSDGIDASASITLQDGITGRAVVTMDTPALLQRQWQISAQLAVLALALTGLVYWLALVPGRRAAALLVELADDSDTHSESMQAYRGLDELGELINTTLMRRNISSADETDSAQQGQCAVMFIGMNHRDELLEDNAVVINQCLRRIQTVCKLYDGDVSVERANGFGVTFRPKDGEETHPFRAVCAGYLISLLWQDENLPLHLSIGIALIADSISDETLQRLATQRTLDAAAGLTTHYVSGLLISDAVACHSSVRNRVEMDGAEEGVLVMGLQTPYDSLLAQQFNTLSQQFAERSAVG